MPDYRQQDGAIHKVYETRYRSSKYFLQDQLRCSDAVEDFRTVKDLLSGTPQFNLRHTFRFATEPIPVVSNQHRR